MMLATALSRLVSLSRDCVIFALYSRARFFCSDKYQGLETDLKSRVCQVSDWSNEQWDDFETQLEARRAIRAQMAQAMQDLEQKAGDREAKVEVKREISSESVQSALRKALTSFPGSYLSR